MDELEECRELVLSGNAEWDVVSRNVEGLMESIEGKIVPAAVREKAEYEVSAEDIKAQLEKMARRCHAENKTSLDCMEERKNVIVKKAYEQLFEISHTKAHLEELKNEDLYLQFFIQCKTIYERDVFGIIRELLQSVSGNYDYMADQMRSMFQSIGGYKNGIGNEKFYLEYEQRKDGIEKSVQTEAETADIGGNDMVSFGQRTKDVIKRTVKKLTRKRKFLAWVPLLILLYFCYLKILKGWCNRQIRKRCGEYLKTELARFEQENNLSPKVDAAMQSATDEYERQYIEVLNQLFMGTDCGEQDQQQNEMTEWNELREKWNTLKYR